MSELLDEVNIGTFINDTRLYVQNNNNKRSSIMTNLVNDIIGEYNKNNNIIHDIRNESGYNTNNRTWVDDILNNIKINLYEITRLRKIIKK